ncbi:MAG: glycosyltransferase [Candidatus Sericytochromatia bacterium]
MPVFEKLPYNLLVGPLHQPLLLGKYIFHPQIRTFVNLNVCEHPELTFPPASLQFHHPHSGTLKALLAQIPGDWKPDLILWWHHYSAIPPDMAESPCPTVLLISDSHAYLTTLLKQVLAFDYILADRPTLKVLQSYGIQNSAFAACYSYDPSRYFPLPETVRDIDISFIGRFNLPLYPQRNPILTQLLALAPKYKLCIRDNVYNAEYNQILNRSKIMLNWSVRGEMNLRAYEAARCGALLFSEEGNLDIPALLPPGEASVLYRADNLLSQLDYFLTHSDQRERMALRAQTLILEQSYEKQFEALLTQLPSHWGQKKRAYLGLKPVDQILSYIRNLCCHTLAHVHPFVSMYLYEQLKCSPELQAEPRMRNAWGVCLFYTHIFTPAAFDPRWPQPLALFRQLSMQMPNNPLVWANRAWAEAHAQDPAAAWESHQQALALLCAPDYQASQLAEMQDFLLPFGAQAMYLQWQQQQFRLGNQPEALATAFRHLLLWHVLLLGAELALSAGRFEYALAAYEQAQALLPELHFPRALAAELLSQMDRPNEAIALFTQYLAEDALNHRVWLGLFATLAKAERWSELQEWAAKAASLADLVSSLACLKEPLAAYVAQGENPI